MKKWLPAALCSLTAFACAHQAASPAASSGSGGTLGAGGNESGGAGGASICPTVSDLGAWPDGQSPVDIGKLAANEFVSHTSEAYHYALALSWYGALRFARATGDQTLESSLVTAFEPWADGSNTVDNTSDVDKRVFGVLPFEIYLLNQDPRALKLGLDRADGQWVNTNSNGITTDARYWIDDMYMITGLQVMAYRATKDPKYLDRSATAMLSYLAALQQPNGLFWHTRQSKIHWGRGNGWVAVGMTELLLELPAGSVRDQIMAAFTQQMDALLAVQVTGGADDGMWRQVLNYDPAPVESSCTAMFTYALVNAAKNGWLTDSKYASAARRGWLALVAKTNSAGQLDLVCEGTGQPAPGDEATQRQYYLDRKLSLGDLHGQAPLLWCAAALLETGCPGLR
jgi:unsaturated rhamnogalacturonyl hydrolase